MVAGKDKDGRARVDAVDRGGGDHGGGEFFSEKRQSSKYKGPPMQGVKNLYSSKGDKESARSGLRP